MDAKKVKGLFLFDQEDEMCTVALDRIGVRLPIFSIDEEQRALAVFEEGKKVAECDVPDDLKGRISRAFVTEIDANGDAVAEFEVEVV